MLIERGQKGDMHAVDELLSLYRTKAFMYALRMTKHSEEAADVVSEAFIRAYKAIGRFQLNSSFATWLYRILKNCFLDIRKKKRVKVVASLDAAMESEDGDLFWQPIDESASPYEVSAMDEHSSKIQTALTKLPAFQKEMLNMYYRDQLTYEEIATKLGAPVGTIKSRLNRARMNFKKIVKEDKDLLALVQG
ncbi:MAG: hypothetical protein BGO01_05995 [Armatimonadetes bacterium 55-13]|nr:MAG: hypothetical protein BGO01_05995 [Armatimonadetes bacterium 55-13]